MEEKENGFGKKLIRFLSYVLVAVLASVLTLTLVAPGNTNSPLPTLGISDSKLEQLQQIILDRYIGEADATALEDSAAQAMVLATGDRWSYYIPASDMKQHQEQKANAYVGIGVTIQHMENDEGFLVIKVEPGGPAKAGGIQPGDVLVAVNGNRISDVGTDAAGNMVSGEEGTTVDITFSRDGVEQTVTLTRAKILTIVAEGQMVSDTIGYIQINNFDDRCASETIAMIEQLEKQGATAFIFDVRFNPGGYKHELVELLDYLLPEGVLFRSEDYRGVTSEDTSDASCKKLPMAVLMNSESYSAAEFFAAALEEYGYAFTVGQATTGKGYFQQTISLNDGSAVNLSVGKYFTPNGVSLAEVGGLVPDILVEVDQETMSLIYSDMVPVEEDVQIQAAIKALQEGYKAGE